MLSVLSNAAILVVPSGYSGPKRTGTGFRDPIKWALTVPGPPMSVILAGTQACSCRNAVECLLLVSATICLPPHTIILVSAH